MSNRYVRVYCDLMNSPIWKDDACVKLYLYCLIKAAWQDVQGKKNFLHAGQLELSQRNSAFELDWSKNTVGKRLAQLADAGLIQITGEPGSISVITLTDTRFCMPVSVVSTDDSFKCPSIINDSKSSMSHDMGHQCPTERDTQLPLSHDMGHHCPTIWDTQPPLSHDMGHHRPTGWDTTVPRDGTDKYINSNAYKNISTSEEPPDFKRLWIAYPEARRVGKGEAMEMYAQALAEGATIEAFLEALNVSKQSDDWQRENGRFIPKLVNWLEKESWRDYLYDPEKEKAEWKTE